MRTVFFFALTLLAALPAQADSPVTRSWSGQTESVTFDNWLKHPEIQDIRHLYEAILADKSLRPSTRVFESCSEGMNEVKRVIYRDDQGRAWLYRTESVSPTDSSLSVAENVYDSEGRLRFTYIVESGKGATHGKIERRLYFDESGRKIWEIWKRAGQNIYFLPETESQDYVTTPEQDFDKAASCPEVTGQAKQDALGPKTRILSQAAADMLLGRHMFSLQWISWDYFGSATVTDREGLLHISGRQDGRPGTEEEDSFVSIEGVIIEVREKEFVFRGDVVMKVSHIAGGRECVRSGDMVFAISGGRKYWRMQNMDNPCDSGVDYVDVFF